MCEMPCDSKNISCNTKRKAIILSVFLLSITDYDHSLSLSLSLPPCILPFVRTLALLSYCKYVQLAVTCNDFTFTVFHVRISRYGRPFLHSFSFVPIFAILKINLILISLQFCTNLLDVLRLNICVYALAVCVCSIPCCH